MDSERTVTPTQTADPSVEADLTRCRKQAEELDDPLLVYLLDMTLLHLRRKAGRPQVASTAQKYLAPTLRH